MNVAPVVISSFFHCFDAVDGSLEDAEVTPHYLLVSGRDNDVVETRRESIDKVFYCLGRLGVEGEAIEILRPVKGLWKLTLFRDSHSLTDGTTEKTGDLFKIFVDDKEEGERKFSLLVGPGLAGEAKLLPKNGAIILCHVGHLSIESLEALELFEPIQVA